MMISGSTEWLRPSVLTHARYGDVPEGTVVQIPPSGEQTVMGFNGPADLSSLTGGVCFRMLRELWWEIELMSARIDNAYGLYPSLPSLSPDVQTWGRGFAVSLFRGYPVKFLTPWGEITYPREYGSNTVNDSWRAFYDFELLAGARDVYAITCTPVRSYPSIGIKNPYHWAMSNIRGEDCQALWELMQLPDSNISLG